MTAFCAKSQIINVPVPIDDLIKIKNAADSAKVHKTHIALLERDTTLLRQQARELTRSRDAYKKGDSLSIINIGLKDQELIQERDKGKLAMDAVAKLNQKLKKKNNTIRLVGISGIVTTIAGIVITSLLKN